MIKIELAPKGDFARGFGAFRDGRSAYYIQQNRGKKSVCVDAKKPAGIEILRALVPKVDVLVENFAPGAIGRMGLGWEDVRKLNPKIVMCSISAFGQTGPLSANPGFDYIAQAYAGVTHMIGDPDTAPALPMLGLGDVSTGTHAMGAVVAALLHRERFGEGQYLDIAILDSYFHCHEMNVQMYSATKGTVDPKRSGTQHTLVSPCGVFRGKQGYLVIIAVLDHQWLALCRTMGRPELATDPRFATNAARVEHRGEVVRLIEEWLATTESDAAALAALQESHIPVAPVLSIGQAIAHPHLRERGTVRTITDRIFGEVEVPGFPLRFSAFPERLPLDAALLGEHNGEVLSQFLGYSQEQIRALETQGVLQSGDR